MRIGMKVSPLTVLRAGIPNYILNLLRALAEVEDQNEYILYTNRPDPLTFPNSPTATGGEEKCYFFTDPLSRWGRNKEFRLRAGYAQCRGMEGIWIWISCKIRVISG